MFIRKTKIDLPALNTSAFSLASFKLLKQSGWNKVVFNHVLSSRYMRRLVVPIYCMRGPGALVSFQQIKQADLLCLSHIYSRAGRCGDGIASFHICHGRLRATAYCRCNSDPSLDRLFPPMTVSYGTGPHFCQQAQLWDQPIII